MRRDFPDCLNPAPGVPWRRPLDEQDVAVRLETEGITDRVAQSDWGRSSTWDIARDAYRRLTGTEELEQPVRQSSELIEHVKGMSFALPLALSCLAMLFLSFSLWGGDLPSEVAAAVAVGTVSSFVVTGGVVQAMARQGLFYAGTGELRMSEVTCRRWLVYGAGVLGATAILALAANSVFEWLPHPLDWTAIAFHLLLGFFWLGTGVLYMLERNLLVAVSATVGIAAVAGLHLSVGLPLIPAQLLGILLAALFATALALRLLAGRAADDSGRVHRLMPVRMLYLTAPYIVYGCLYYLLLFADRLMAWTAQTQSASLPLVFRGDYELPLDIALFAFVLQVGWVHSSMLRFYSRVKSAQTVCEVDRAHEFNFAMQRFYRTRLLLFLPLALVVSVLVWLVAARAGLLHDQLSIRIAVFALVGYPFLVIGLWNVSLLFALSLPKAVLPAVAIGTMINGATGYFLSRALSYEWAVAGFALGALAFGLISSATVFRRFRDLDYYFFASAA
jgi:hypothetical protein